jgi:putative MATE family efflux protein
LQALTSASRTVVDSFLVSRLGAAEVAAVGYSSRVIFVVMMAVMGMSDGGAVVVAQFWGRGDVARTRQATALTTAAAALISVASCVACFVWAEQIARLGTSDPAVVELATGYLRSVILMIIPFALISAFASSLRCLGSAWVAMAFSAVGLALHLALSYCLIFGNGGLPALGLTGAALATVISTFVECGMFVAYIYGRRHPMAFRARDLMIGFRNRLLRKIRKVAVPVLFSSVSWAVGIMVFGVLVGNAGVRELAVLSLVTPIESAVVAIVHGVATASAVLIGNSLGEGVDDARIWLITKALMMWNISIAALLSGLLVLTSLGMRTIYGGIDDETLDVAQQTTLVLAALFLFRATGMILQNGLLRAGGDTVYILYADAAFQWLVAIPLTFLAIFVWHLPFPLVYACIYTEEIARTVVSGYRVYRRRWMGRLAEH